MFFSVAPLPRSDDSLPGSGEIATVNVPFWNTCDTVVVVIGWFRLAVVEPMTGMPVTWHDSGTFTGKLSAPAGASPTVPIPTRNAVVLSASADRMAPNLVRMFPPHRARDTRRDPRGRTGAKRADQPGNPGPIPLRGRSVVLTARDTVSTLRRRNAVTAPPSIWEPSVTRGGGPACRSGARPTDR